MLMLLALSFLLTCMAQDVMLSVPVNIDGISHDLSIHRGETPVMAASSFAQTKGLMAREDANGIIAQLSDMLKERLAQKVSEMESKQVLFTVPIAINGQDTILDVHDGDTMSDLINMYVTKYSIEQEYYTELIPQLETVIQARFQKYMTEQATEVAPKWLFTLPLNLAGEQFEIAHYEGQDPMAEARIFCKENQIRPELVEEIVPQIAQMIAAQMSKSSAAPSMPSMPAALFSVPITINDQEFELIHYEGYRPLDSVVNFLNERGVTDAATQQEYAPQLLSILTQRLETNEAQPTPVFSIPLVIGEAQVDLHYFEGQDPEELATAFADQNGLRGNPDFEAIVEQISVLVRNEMTARNLVVPGDITPLSQEPLFTIPINWNSTVHELHFFAQQVPDVVAFDFCKSKLDILTDSSDESVILTTLNECAHFITETIASVLERLEKEASENTVKALFTLDINIGNGQMASVPFFAGNDPQTVATEICTRFSLDVENIPAVVQAIQAELVKGQQQM